MLSQNKAGQDVIKHLEKLIWTSCTRFLEQPPSQVMLLGEAGCQCSSIHLPVFMCIFN